MRQLSKKKSKKAKPKSTGELRVITTDLPGYKFPYAPVNTDIAFGYTLVQARSEDGVVWAPRWCLIDTDGTPLAIFEADSFEGLDSDSLAQKASEFLMDLHELGEEETGVKTEVLNINNDNESHSYKVL